MPDQDPRAVLGLPLDATRGEAQRAFRRLAKQTHPDAGGDATEFRTVASAWADLALRLPPDRPAVAPSRHVLAYRAPRSQVLWAEPRRPASAAPVRRPDFQAVLATEMARRAA